MKRSLSFFPFVVCPPRYEVFSPRAEEVFSLVSFSNFFSQCLSFAVYRPSTFLGKLCYFILLNAIINRIIFSTSFFDSLLPYEDCRRAGPAAALVGRPALAAVLWSLGLSAVTSPSAQRRPCCLLAHVVALFPCSSHLWLAGWGHHIAVMDTGLCSLSVLILGKAGSHVSSVLLRNALYHIEEVPSIPGFVSGGALGLWWCFSGNSDHLWLFSSCY